MKMKMESGNAMLTTCLFNSYVYINRAKGAVEIIFRSSSDRATAEKDYISKFANPLPAAQRGYIDDVIEPSTTRRRIIEDLEMLRTKKQENPKRKHGNIPL